jgi:hypothetical protein
MKKCVVYYTDNKVEDNLDVAVRAQLQSACGDIPIISVSQIPMDFGKNLCVGRKPRNYTSLHEQLLTGVLAADDDAVIYVAEHDVFYHPHHFEFVPPKDKIYFNLHRYYFKLGLKGFLPTAGKRAYSQCVARKAPLENFLKRKLLQRYRGDSCFIRGDFANFMSRSANVDIRHGGNFSAENRDKGSWLYGGEHDLEKKEIPGWGTVGEFQRQTGYRNWKVGTQDYLLDWHDKLEGRPFYREDIDVLFADLGFNHGAEIGVGVGEHAISLCSKNPYLNLLCIDPYDPYTTIDGEHISWDSVEQDYVDCKQNLRLFQHTEIIRKTSIQAANLTPKSSLDFVYIDGSFWFNDVMRDIIMWTDRVRPGGIVSGSNIDCPSVKTAVDAYSEAHGYNVFVTASDEKNIPCWFFAKGDLNVSVTASDEKNRPCWFFAKGDL